MESSPSCRCIVGEFTPTIAAGVGAAVVFSHRPSREDGGAYPR